MTPRNRNVIDTTPTPTVTAATVRSILAGDSSPLPGSVDALLELTPKTIKALDELRDLKQREEATRPIISELLLDDAKPPEKLAAEIGEQKALADVLRARRVRRRDECLAAIVADGKQAEADAIAAAKVARESYSSARMAGERKVKSEFGDNRPLVKPTDLLEVRAAAADTDAANDHAGAVGSLLDAIDAARIEQRRDGDMRFVGCRTTPRETALSNAAKFWSCFG